MSASSEARTAFVSLVSAALPGVQVNEVPMAEDTALRECVHVVRTESLFDWRSLGGTAHFRRNRSEQVRLTFHAHVYREAADHRVASAEALARAEVILEAVEHAVADNPTLNGAVTHARVSDWDVAPEPRESGWAVRCSGTVTADSFPTS